MRSLNRLPFPLSVLTLALVGAQSAFAANDLYISEYIEGSACNKAIEIYNGTGAAVNLSGYQIRMYMNGSASAGVTISLSGQLAAGDVHVVANNVSGCSTSSTVLAQADTLNSAGWYNGDDAVALIKNGSPIDVIGQIGVDPGTAWGNSGETLNHTLRRKSAVTDGDPNGADAFDPTAQWDLFAQDSFDDLGAYSGTVTPPPPPVSQCGQPATPIHAIQGNGATSPLLGQPHSIEGVVTGVFQGSGKLNGFFVQQRDSDIDSDPSTSEGLFVYDAANTTVVNVGDVVRVAGTVTEYFDLTELNNVSSLSVCASGATVTATPVLLPLNSATALERLEGMLISNDQGLTVSEHYNLARYGQLTLSYGRLYIPTHTAAPGAAANAVAANNSLNRILLDDGSNTQNPTLVPYPAPALSAANSLRVGDAVTRIRGVLNYAFGAYVIEPVAAPVILNQNPRSGAPTKLGRTRVASFNVLNYFNGNGQGGGFPTSRGATTAGELARQEAKIIAAMTEMNADVFGLMEIENDGYGATSAIQGLVSALNAASGEQYAAVNPGVAQLGTDEIAVGLIYNSAKVRQIGAAATTSAYPFNTSNRQPLAVTFEDIASQERFTVVVNHFKSKGSCPGDAGVNDDQGDGQSCWNAKRVEAANALLGWLAAHPTGSNDPDKIIIGDLNAYAKEDPISAIIGAGYKNLLHAFNGDAAYSYVFNAETGYLDHALASAAMAKQTVAAREWHINADEPRALDYNEEFKTAAQVVSFYAADAYRSSDHDPVMVDLILAKPGDFNADGLRNGVDLTLLLRENYKPVTAQNWKFDLNNDNAINAADVSYFQRNYNGK